MCVKYRCCITILAIILVLSGTKAAYCQDSETDSLKAQLLSRKQNDTTKVRLLNELAFGNYGVNIDDLKSYANKALLLSTQLKYPRGQAIAYKNLGLGCMLVNGDPVALQYFERSLNLFHQLGDKVNEARVLNNIGYYYINLKDYQQAIRYLNMALDKIAGLKRTHFESILLGNIGDSYVELGDYKKAAACFLREIELAKKLTEWDAAIIGYSNLASLAVKQHNYPQAGIYLQKLLKYQQTPDFRQRDKVDLVRLQGEIAYGLKNYSLAQKLLTESFKLAKSTGSIEQKLASQYDLYLLDSVTRNYRDAMIRINEYHKLKDSITNANRSQLIALYQTRFELEKRKEENQHLKDIAEIYKTTISSQHIRLIIMLVILIVIIAGLLYFKRINEQINKKNEIIKEQNTALENNGHVKDKIFSVISHDLRSPIAQMVSLLGLLESREIEYDEFSQLTPVVKGSIINTLELLDNLLVWSKNQLQGFTYSPAAFNLNELIAENIRGLDTMITHKSLYVNNNIPADINIFADKEMMKIVFRNLISNAIKFTPEKGRITINQALTDKQIVISVEDTGIGIKDKDKDKVFAFGSHSTPGTNQEKGTGMGLKLCFDFIQMNKGTMWMESTEGKGSKFYVGLPYQVPANGIAGITQPITGKQVQTQLT